MKFSTLSAHIHFISQSLGRYNKIFPTNIFLRSFLFFVCFLFFTSALLNSLFTYILFFLLSLSFLFIFIIWCILFFTFVSFNLFYFSLLLILSFLLYNITVYFFHCDLFVFLTSLIFQSTSVCMLSEIVLYSNLAWFTLYLTNLRYYLICLFSIW